MTILVLIIWFAVMGFKDGMNPTNLQHHLFAHVVLRSMIIDLLACLLIVICELWKK